MKQVVVDDFRTRQGTWFKSNWNKGRGVFVKTVSYVVWESMFRRCYQKHPNYVGCTVGEDFKDYQKFVEWHRSQAGYCKGFHLDKDLLVRGNRQYSGENCVLLPQEINKAIALHKSTRGKLPVGVWWDKRRSVFTVRFGKDCPYLGQHATAEEAFEVYKLTKEKQVRDLAEIWKGRIEQRAYEALINYRVMEITE